MCGVMSVCHSIHRKRGEVVLPLPIMTSTSVHRHDQRTLTDKLDSNFKKKT